MGLSLHEAVPYVLIQDVTHHHMDHTVYSVNQAPLSEGSKIKGFVDI